MTCEHRDFAKFHHLIDLIGGAVFWIIQDTVSVSTVDHPQYRLVDHSLVSSIILVFFSCLPYFSGSRAASDRAQITPLSDASTTAATFHYVGLTDDGSFCTSPNLFTFLSLYCLNIRLFPATNYSAYSDKWYFACPRNYTTVYSVGLL